MTHNMNLTFRSRSLIPERLDRGLSARFNGYSEDHIKLELKPISRSTVA
jgi:hypothetical protein